MEIEDSETNDTQKFNFKIQVDESTKSGLSGIPENVENWILASFTKDEIMEDPQKIIQCMFEADILKR